MARAVSLFDGLEPERGDGFVAHMGNPDFVLSLARGLRVIACFQGHREGRSIVEIAQATRLSRASIRRILLTLEMLGYVERALKQRETTQGSLFFIHAACRDCRRTRKPQIACRKPSQSLVTSAPVDNFSEMRLPAGGRRCSLFTDMAGTNGTPSNNNAPVTIFVVDDEPMLLEMAVMILEPLNFRVRTFRDPQNGDSCFRGDLTGGDRDGLRDALDDRHGFDSRMQTPPAEAENHSPERHGGSERLHQSGGKPDRFLAKPYQVSDFVTWIQSLATA